MALQVYNVLTRAREEFKPLNENLVTMYVCGPTVYDHAHLGHAKTYVSFDVILRHLRSRYRVRYVQNITDVGHILDDTGEDRILKGAARERVEPMELVEKYTRSYFEDMDALGVTRPDISPRASGHVPEQIELVKTLIEKGHAYEVNGSVYFHVPSFPGYGKLSGRKLEDMIEGARVEVHEDKRHPADFALWKKAEPGHILKWPSPWGWGYPGWHAECTAMSAKYLGETFDIHGGGVDNIFPHNECEIAQSEAASGKPFARYWLLTGSLTVDGVKMSKSLGNFVTVKEYLKTHRPETIRLFILTSHYSHPVDFSESAIEAADGGRKRLANTIGRLADAGRAAPEGDAGDSIRSLVGEHRARFTGAMDDDFNTSAALGTLFDLARETNTLLDADTPLNSGELAALQDAFKEMGRDTLGVLPQADRAEAGGELLDGLVRMLIELRKDARDRKDWGTADAIRDRLKEMGIALEDRPEGTTWRLDG